MKLHDKFAKIGEVTANALNKSVFGRLLGMSAIQSSFYYKILCMPSSAMIFVRKKYGKSVRNALSGSFAARFLSLRNLVIAAAILAPFFGAAMYVVGILMIAAFFLKTVSETKKIRKPTVVEALIYLFVLIYYVFIGNFSFFGILSLMCMRPVMACAEDDRTRTAVCSVLAVSSAAASSLGLLNSVYGIFGEFYILMISFCFSNAFSARGACRKAQLAAGIILTFDFFILITQGQITPAGVALCVYLCLRDTRFFVPAMILFATIFGIFGDIIKSARDYNMVYLSGAFALAMSWVFYINLPQDMRKKSFVKAVIAAVGGTSAVLVSLGGGGSPGFIFWMIVALSMPVRETNVPQTSQK